MNKLEKKDLLKITGGDLKDALVVTYMQVYKYSSLTGALIVGITKGYYSEKEKE